jgi:hypothetical protein
MNLDAFRDNFKAIKELSISTTAKFVGQTMLVLGVRSAAEIIEHTGLSRSAVYRALADLSEVAGDEFFSAIPINPTCPADGTETLISVPSVGLEQKEIPPTPPKEKTTTNLETSVSHPTTDRASCEPAGWQNLKTAFNGSTEAMLTDVQRFMGPIADRTNAANWLTGMLSAVGQARTIEAWQIVTSKAGSGQIVANPLALWSKTARGLKETPAGAKPIDRANMRFMPSRYGPGKWVPIEGAVQ